MNKLSYPAKIKLFLTQKHGKRLIYRGMRNGVAYYNLKGKGLFTCNRQGQVTLFPRFFPSVYRVQCINQATFDFNVKEA